MVYIYPQKINIHKGRVKRKKTKSLTKYSKKKEKKKEKREVSSIKFFFFKKKIHIHIVTHVSQLDQHILSILIISYHSLIKQQV